jgi:Zn-dependent protease with chaperone function
MNALAAVVALAVAAVANLVLFIATSRRVKAIGASENPDRIHALRVLTRRVSPIAFCCGMGAVLVGFLLSVSQSRSASFVPGSASFVTLLIVMLACLAGARTAMIWPIRRGIAAARGIPPQSLRSDRRLAVGLISIVLQLAPFVVAWAIPLSLADRVLLIVVGNVVICPLLLGLLAPVFARIVAPSVASAELASRLSALSHKVGVHVQGRVMQMLARREARAQQLGWLPGLRYVLVSDYLLERLPEPEADAILCHELAHAVHRDGLVRAMISSVPGACLGVMLLLGVTRAPESDFLIAVAIALAAVFGIGRLRSAVIIRQELAADQFAANVEGRGQLISALNMLADTNAIKRDTSPSWERWINHPAMARRIALLETTAPPS